MLLKKPWYLFTIWLNVLSIMQGILPGSESELMTLLTEWNHWLALQSPCLYPGRVSAGHTKLGSLCASQRYIQGHFNIPFIHVLKTSDDSWLSISISGQHCLDPDAYMLDVYRANPQAEWVIKPKASWSRRQRCTGQKPNGQQWFLSFQEALGRDETKW